MDFAALIAVAAPAIDKIVDFTSFVLARQWAAVAKQASAWTGGVAVALVAAHSDFASAVGLTGLNSWSVVMAGFALGSTGSLIADARQVLDNAQSAATPSYSLRLFRGTARAKRQTES